jgi:hypothetical protein
MALSRDQLPAVALPQEPVAVPGLGGDVIVRGMDMPQMLRFTALRRRLLTPQEGETEDQASERAAGELVPLALEMCTVLDDGLPVYSAAQWATFGAQHSGDVMALWEAAIRLSGQQPDHEKKA